MSDNAPAPKPARHAASRSPHNPGNVRASGRIVLSSSDLETLEVTFHG